MTLTSCNLRSFANKSWLNPLPLKGDSGGPLVSKQGPQWVQSGVVSFSVPCARPNFPAVYARVSEYQAWILSMITTNQPGFIDFRSTGTDSDSTFKCGPATTATAPITCASDARFPMALSHILLLSSLYLFSALA